MAKDTIFRIYSMTKPITSVAAMMLWEEGRFLLNDPIAKYLPDLSDLEVAVERGGEIERVPVERAITIQDLLRHTSGLTYELRGSGPVHKMYMSAKVYRRIAPLPGSIGQYFWNGLAGTTFWVDPAEQMFALMLVQAPGQRDYYRTLFRDLAYAAVED
jgi:CubicO group peptidase (beta-lactamase class C family)